MNVSMIKLEEGLKTAVTFTCSMILAKCTSISFNIEMDDIDTAKPLLVEVHNYMFILKNLISGVEISSFEGLNIVLKDIENKVDSFDKILRSV